MILEVPFERFIEEVNDRIADKHVYTERCGRGAVVTAADPKDGWVIMSRADSAQLKLLNDAGFVVREGRWRDTDPELADGVAELWVAGVAYKGRDRGAGLWISAFENEPSQAEVLQAWYDEIVENGELQDEIAIERLIDVVKPNVVIVSPSEARGFAERDEEI